MLKNYLKIAFRNLAKHKGYSFINIFGLAIGIGCCLLIFLYVKDELTYDRFQSKIDRIYRINSKIDWFGTINEMGATNRVEAKEYAERIPEIEAYTRYNGATIVVQSGDEWVSQYNAVYADTGTFDIFDYKVLSGTLDGALVDLNSIVISEEVALKYFDRIDVAGEELTIKLQSEIENYRIDAVFEDFPTNSSLYSQVYFPWAKLESFEPVNPARVWGSIGISSIVLLKDEAIDTKTIESKMKDVRILLNPDESAKWAREIDTTIQPFVSLHLSNQIQANAGIRSTGNPFYSYILAGIGFLILILACINFANLSVARSIPRAKEIGLRKVLGAQKTQVARQFLGEAFYVSIIAFVFGLILAELFLPTFGELTNKTFSEGVIEDTWLIVACLGFVTLTAVISGAYPAFFVARFSILNSLSGKVKLSGRQYLTKGLLVFQFAIAAILVTGTLAMNSQIQFMLDTDLGYDDKNLGILDIWGNQKNANVIYSELAKDPNIESISTSSGFGSATSLGYGEEEFFCTFLQIDTAFVNTFGLTLLEGRNLKHLSDEYYRSTDTLTNLLVTKEFLKRAKIEVEPLGLAINSGGGEDAKEQYRIVGILDDFIYSSARSGIGPVAMMMGSADKGNFNKINVKFREGYATEIENVVEEAFKKVDPYSPLNFHLEEESNLQSYQDESRWKSIITYSSVIAIIISCLGLFGMAHLSAQNRQKEIGVRKVLGASISQLIYMLNLSFGKLILIASFIAIPVAYYLLDDWLSNFAFRIDLGVLVFAIPTIITLLIALSTVSIQSFRTANSNPVDSLRNE